jgi:hypothetical protein
VGVGLGTPKPPPLTVPQTYKNKIHFFVFLFITCHETHLQLNCILLYLMQPCCVKMKIKQSLLRLSITLLTVFSLYSVWVHSLEHLDQNDRTECQLLIHNNLDFGESTEEVFIPVAFFINEPAFSIETSQKRSHRVHFQKQSRAPPFLRLV